jgi:hypothetical protein
MSLPLEWHRRFLPFHETETVTMVDETKPNQFIDSERPEGRHSEEIGAVRFATDRPTVRCEFGF